MLKKLSFLCLAIGVGAWAADEADLSTASNAQEYRDFVRLIHYPNHSQGNPDEVAIEMQSPAETSQQPQTRIAFVPNLPSPHDALR